MSISLMMFSQMSKDAIVDELLLVVTKIELFYGPDIKMLKFFLPRDDVETKTSCCEVDEED